MHRSRTLLFENPCAHSICSFDRRINHSYMRFCSIRCALLAHYNESGVFFLDLMRDLAHGAAQINPCGDIHVYCPGVGAHEPMGSNFFQNH